MTDVNYRGSFQASTVGRGSIPTVSLATDRPGFPTGATESPIVGICEAARIIGKSTATIRRWIAEGAPCVSPGEAGRGKGAMVNVGDLQRWRHGAKQDDREFLERLSGALLDFYKRDTGVDEPAHRTLRIGDRAAAALYVTLFEYTAHCFGCETDTDPEPIARLRQIACG